MVELRIKQEAQKVKCRKLGAVVEKEKHAPLKELWAPCLLLLLLLCPNGVFVLSYSRARGGFSSKKFIPRHNRTRFTNTNFHYELRIHALLIYLDYELTTITFASGSAYDSVSLVPQLRCDVIIFLNIISSTKNYKQCHNKYKGPDKSKG